MVPFLVPLMKHISDSLRAGMAALITTGSPPTLSENQHSSNFLLSYSFYRREGFFYNNYRLQTFGFSSSGFNI
jgi:hypothetical protein